MYKTTNEQVNTSLESPLWEEVSDESADACVGGIGGRRQGSQPQSGDLISTIQDLLGTLFQPGELKQGLQNLAWNNWIVNWYDRH